ncbi:MAG: hypothetical protein HQL14_01070 [Candidatus Omnitrophica bacterium]|nr:hypothetical protein [Candidatus Omnitrophota bacterium]
MKRKIFLLFSGLMFMSLCGCVSTMIAQQAANQAAPPKAQSFSFDVSKPGADAGTLYIQTRQPSYQMVVAKYAIKIDSNPPLVVEKQSDVTIKINVGKHSLKFYGTSDNPAESDKVVWGEPNKKDIVIAKDQVLKFKYTGPYRMFGSGNVEEIK